MHVPGWLLRLSTLRLDSLLSREEVELLIRSAAQLQYIRGFLPTYQSGDLVTYQISDLSTSMAPEASHLRPQLNG